MKQAVTISEVNGPGQRAAMHALREAVFVLEQGVPAGQERDSLDEDCRHVLATDPDGSAVGTGRLAPDGRIGRMAVRADRRGQGIGEAVLRALLRLAERDGLTLTRLHAQLAAQRLYARHGFVAHGPRFTEAGIEHRAMQRHAGAMFAVDDLESAAQVTATLVHGARRNLWLRSQVLDPGLLDHPEVLDALRRFATGGRGGQVQVLLQDAATVQRAQSPLLALAQRLPSVFAFREVDDAVDHPFAGAVFINDGAAFFQRVQGHRIDGRAATAMPGRTRQLAQEFAPVWERSRPCNEFRALGI